MHKLTTSSMRCVRVLITREAWDSTLRTLLLERDRFAVGDVQWRREDAGEEVLCRRLETVRQLPTGLARPPFDDWLVAVVERDHGASATEWARRLEPRRSQRLIVVVLNDSDRSRCVTIVGAGRLGSLIAFHLAGLGVPRLRLIDPDVLELANLDAMPGLTERDVGRAKVAALAKRLLAFRRDLLVSYAHRSALDLEAQRLMRRRTDLLVTCVDDDAPRLCASLIAKQTLTVHLDVATQVTRPACLTPTQPLRRSTLTVMSHGR